MKYFLIGFTLLRYTLNALQIENLTHLQIFWAVYLLLFFYIMQSFIKALEENEKTL